MSGPDERPAGCGRLFVVRHGQTGGNGQRYVGWEDEPLDPVGIEQARAVAARLGAEAIDAVYSSPLSRALDTARPLAARLGLAVAVREELKEIDYGRFQGLSKTEQSVKLRHDFLFEPVPGGESLNDVYRRVGRAWAELREELARGRTLAVVGHYWSNRILVGAIHGLALEEVFQRTRYKPANGSIYRLDFLSGADGKPAVSSAAWLGEGTAGAVD